MMNEYIGRFAPSPSGPLHFGSLIAALGSYFQAKANQGKWLVRIEDLDPPREMPGADKLILDTLEAHQLFWDGEVIYQSQRHAAYQAQIDAWLANGMAYYCNCTRKQIKADGGYYLGHCRNANVPAGDAAIRLQQTHCIESFQDLALGEITIPRALAQEDFIIKRRDGLFAYNLAVVLDDIYQGVTQVVRGADLLEPTGRQISLYHLLGQTPVSYLHLPLALDESGNKLSKQNHAPAIENQHAKQNIIHAMQFLGFETSSLMDLSLAEILDFGIKHWTIP